MATLLQFPARPAPRAGADQHRPPAPAAVIILPCVRRERIGAAR